jgi:hypothetical protein
MWTFLIGSYIVFINFSILNTIREAIIIIHNNHIPIHVQIRCVLKYSQIKVFFLTKFYQKIKVYLVFDTNLAVYVSKYTLFLLYIWAFFLDKYLGMFYVHLDWTKINSN